MSCSALQPNDAASNLPEDAVIFGLSLPLIRELAEARGRVKNGFVRLHVVHDRDDRVSIEDSKMLPRKS